MLKLNRKTATDAQRMLEMYEGLFEANAAVTSSLDRDEVLHLVMTKAKELLNAEAASIFLLDEKTDELVLVVSTNIAPEDKNQIRFPKGLGVAGWVAQHGKPVVTRDIQSDPRFYTGIQDKTGFHTTSYLCVPLLTQERVIGTAQVLNRKSGDTFSEDELHIMEGFARQAAIALENARLHEEELAKKRIEEELQLAHKIQLDLLPKNAPDADGYEIAGVSLPSRWVGGDYYDYIRLDNERMLLVIADVSGKGAPAALLMSTIQAVLKSATSLNLPLAELVVHLNRYLCRNSANDKFATCFFAVLNHQEHSLEYINCGHNPPFLIKKNGGMEPLKEGGLILGIIEKADFAPGIVEMLPGDILLLYTDGVTEAHNAEREMYEEHRLLRLLSSLQNIHPAEIIQNIHKEVLAFAFENQPEDDITMVCVRRVH